MYLFVRGMCGENFVGRDHIGMEISMMLSQSMKTQFQEMSQSEKIVVLCVL